MERYEETHICFKCPRDFVPVGPRPIALPTRLVVTFVARNHGAITDVLLQQILEFITTTEDRAAFVDRVCCGLCEAIARCARVRRAGTPVRAILFRHDLLFQDALSFVVDCLPGWERPVIIPEPCDVPREFTPDRLDHLGYRLMMDAADGLEVDFYPNTTLMFTLSFFDPRP